MFGNNYLSKSKTFERKISSPVNPNIDAIVSIPCYDEDFLFSTLDSLNAAMLKCPSKLVEVIVVINSSKDSSEEIVHKNLMLSQSLNEFCGEESAHYSFTLHQILLENIPPKIAGVGYARRVGMDEAVCRYNDISKPDGLIISLNADSLVSENYFSSIFSAVKANKKSPAYVFGFCHNYDTKLFSEEEIVATKLYEKYLYYHKENLKIAGFPHYFHTIGSCFACTAIAYIKAGAMPCRQAGEDFYFLHKLANLGDVFEISETLVFPASRVSNRVPFGTGKAVDTILENKYFDVYNHKLYSLLKTFFSSFDEIFEAKSLNIDKIPNPIVNFMGEDELNNIFDDCFKNSSNLIMFKKRLFVHFNAFWIVKFFNSFKNSTDFPPERWYFNI